MSETNTRPSHENASSARPSGTPAGAGRLGGLMAFEGRFTDAFLFGDCLTDPEKGRRGRLISRFGLLGFLFGMIFATFYLFIGHRWGAAIVLICSVGFGLTPLLMKVARSLDLAGNFLVAIMTAGFAALCCVEGGLSGHAIAWLAIVPLCALLLAGKRAARTWLVICFVAISGVIGVALAGISLPTAYPVQWQPIVSATGYLALIVFMFCLGMIFETGRERAFTKMQDALSKLEASNEQLVNLNNEKNEFMGIAAHDLKNPLTTIILGAEMMQGTNPATHHHTIIKGIASAGTRMRDLITQLLDANAIEQGRYISKIEYCDLAGLAAQCVTHNQTAASRKQIDLRFSAPGEVPARVDRDATVQILENLISNAVKYSPQQTTVQIRGYIEQDRACVSVTDHGPGISGDDQKKMFGKFTRLSAKPTGGESSNGLGLSIVKRLAEAMNGCVECRSVLGAGATFTIRLPMWHEDGSEPIAQPPQNKTDSQA